MADTPTRDRATFHVDTTPIIPTHPSKIDLSKPMSFEADPKITAEIRLHLDVRKMNQLLGKR